MSDLKALRVVPLVGTTYGYIVVTAEDYLPLPSISGESVTRADLVTEVARTHGWTWDGELPATSEDGTADRTLVLFERTAR